MQIRADYSTAPFVRFGTTFAREASTILADAGRTEPLAYGTVMSQVAATKKWVPFTDETATDGTAIGKGVYIGPNIPADDLVAGDVVDVPILVGGNCTLDSRQLIIENSLTIDTVVGAATIGEHRLEDDLNRIGIFIEDTIDIDSFENS